MPLGFWTGWRGCRGTGRRLSQPIESPIAQRPEPTPLHLGEAALSEMIGSSILEDGRGDTFGDAPRGGTPWLPATRMRSRVTAFIQRLPRYGRERIASCTADRRTRSRWARGLQYVWRKRTTLSRQQFARFVHKQGGIAGCATKIAKVRWKPDPSRLGFGFDPNTVRSPTLTSGH